MQEAYININNIPTKVSTYGKWITESIEGKIILIIPGNPGITDFYKTFMKYLFEKHNCPVWSLGYSGHEYPRQKSVKMNFPEPLGLADQIRQKVSFIQQYIPQNAELHIIGHSIGSYMTLELLKEPSIEERIVQTYLLFPTIEKMRVTPNGKFMSRFIRPILPLVIFLSWIFSILPKIISINLLTTYMWLTNTPIIYKSTIYNLINPKVLEQVFFLAYQELEQVKIRDDENIKCNVHRINLLYGEEDGWCFPTFCDDIKNKFPNIRARKSRYQHTFVFHENEEVADVVNKWMMV